MPALIHPRNVPGPIHVTDDCIGCGQCFSGLPEVFAEDEHTYAYVTRQPDTAELLEAVHHAMERCPAECIIEAAAA